MKIMKIKQKHKFLDEIVIPAQKHERTSVFTTITQKGHVKQEKAKERSVTRAHIEERGVNHCSVEQTF